MTSTDLLLSGAPAIDAAIAARTERRMRVCGYCLGSKLTYSRKLACPHCAGTGCEPVPPDFRLGGEFVPEWTGMQDQARALNYSISLLDRAMGSPADRAVTPPGVLP